MRLAAAGKDQRKIITAVGRELLGFSAAKGTSKHVAMSAAFKTAIIERYRRRKASRGCRLGR